MYVITKIYFYYAKEGLLFPMIKNVPIPTVALTLGLVSYGNLIAPYSQFCRYLCGILDIIFFLLVACKMLIYPMMVQNDLIGDAGLASVFAAFWMSLMLFCPYLHDFFPIVSKYVWLFAIAGHAALICWFTYYHIYKMAMRDVYPSYFITYVGIVVASVTAPLFHCDALGNCIFWFGFISYLLIFIVVTMRYFSRPDNEAAEPLFCIYTAPMSLCLAGYLSSPWPRSTILIIGMGFIAQALLFIVLSQMPRLLRTKFYPSFSAFTFPFVITASALKGTIKYFSKIAMPLPHFFSLLLTAEIVIAGLAILYVTIGYIKFLIKSNHPTPEKQ